MLALYEFKLANKLFTISSLHLKLSSLAVATAFAKANVIFFNLEGEE